jgi:LPXTG-site transpeptidase (sortase) family protein
MEKSSEKNFSLFSQAKKTIFIFCGFFVFFFVILSLVQFLNFMVGEINLFLQTSFLAAEPLPISSLFPSSSSAIVQEPAFVPTAKGNSLEIAGLKIEAPIVIADSTEIKDLSQNLNQGVVIYPGSALPGQPGQLLILGHSAPAFWPKIRYDWVFSNLGNLQNGDEILVNLDQRQYRYQVTREIFLERGEQIPQNNETNSHRLYLITCWPPGRDFRRLAVEAVLTP